jgi:hypothetical protein
MRKVKLPSGAELTINPAPFVDAKNLYQALLRELKEVQIDLKMEMANLYKELFCVGFSSPQIEGFLWKCLERCTYDNGKTGPMKIDGDTFEPLEAREDYMSVCTEVTKENVAPFVKTLFADYAQFSQMIENTRK